MRLEKSIKSKDVSVAAKTRVAKNPVITSEIDSRMRALAHHVIDRMLEDYKRGLLKLPTKQAILLDKVIKMKSMNSVQE